MKLKTMMAAALLAACALGGTNTLERTEWIKNVGRYAVSRTEFGDAIEKVHILERPDFVFQTLAALNMMPGDAAEKSRLTAELADEACRRQDWRMRSFLIQVIYTKAQVESLPATTRLLVHVVKTDAATMTDAEFLSYEKATVNGVRSRAEALKVDSPSRRVKLATVLFEQAKQLDFEMKATLPRTPLDSPMSGVERVPRPIPMRGYEGQETNPFYRERRGSE